MRMMFRIAAPIALGLSTSACLGSLLGGKTPDYLLTLTSTAPPTGATARAAAAGETVTIDVPIIPKVLDQVRVPAQSGPTTIAYIEDLQLVDTPDKLFQQLLAETVTRTTSRVVLSPEQASLDPGLRVTGTIHRFGYDSQTGEVVVIYEGALSTAGGTRVETRRFEARAPADGTAATVGPSLNQAANEVALQAAQWIGG